MARNILIALVLLLAACQVSESVDVSIVRALQPSEDCLWANSNDTWQSGWFDPRAAATMELHFELAVEPASLFTLDGFEVCYGLEEPLDCEAEGGYREIVPAQWDDQGPAMVSVMSRDVLSGLFGSGFAPDQISVWFQQSTDPCCRYFETDLFLLFNEDRACCDQAEWSVQAIGATGEDRPEAWAAFEQLSVVHMQIQARGKSESGHKVESEWFSFATEICLGCSMSHSDALGCEPLVGRVCDHGICHLGEGAYGDGETAPCTEEGCPLPDKPCYQYTYELQGESPSVQGCVPAQLQGIRSRCSESEACGT